MRRILKKQGFPVYLIDEHKTSTLCLTCKEGELEKFAKVPNSRPFRRSNQPKVLCHGLLRSKNQNCLESRKQWNRDLVAVLNFREIMNSHRQALGRPVRFQRETLKRSSKNIQASYSPPSKKQKFRSTPPDEGRASA